MKNAATSALLSYDSKQSRRQWFGAHCDVAVMLVVWIKVNYTTVVPGVSRGWNDSGPFLIRIYMRSPLELVKKTLCFNRKSRDPNNKPHIWRILRQLSCGACAKSWHGPTFIFQVRAVWILKRFGLWANNTFVKSGFSSCDHDRSALVHRRVYQLAENCLTSCCFCS